MEWIRYEKCITRCKENFYALVLNGDEVRTEFFALMRLSFENAGKAQTGSQFFTAITLPNLLLQKPGYKYHIMGKSNSVPFAFSEFIKVTIAQKDFWYGENMEHRQHLLEVSSLRRTKILDAMGKVIELTPEKISQAVEKKYRCYLEIDQLPSMDQKLSLLIHQGSSSCR